MFESERVWPLIAELSRKSTVFAGGIGISWANVPEGAIMPVTYSGVSSPEFFYGSGRCESFYFHSRWLTGTESGGNLESPHSFFFFFAYSVHFLQIMSPPCTTLFITFRAAWALGMPNVRFPSCCWFMSAHTVSSNHSEHHVASSDVIFTVNNTDWQQGCNIFLEGAFKCLWERPTFDTFHLINGKYTVI